MELLSYVNKIHDEKIILKNIEDNLKKINSELLDVYTALRKSFYEEDGFLERGVQSIELDVKHINIYKISYLIEELNELGYVDIKKYELFIRSYNGHEVDATEWSITGFNYSNVV